MVLNVLKVFGLGIIAFFLGVSITPILTRLLHSYKAWPVVSRTKAITGETASVVAALRKDEPLEVPRLGGILIWGTVFMVTMGFWLLSEFIHLSLFTKLNFLSRNQTWLPLFTLVSASIVGLIDDVLHIMNSGGYVAGGLALRKRVFLVAVLGLIGALWFYSRLEQSSIIFPFLGEIELGIWYIVFFIFVMISTFSGGIIDGIGGLSGGVFAAIFSAYLGIAFFQNQIDLAAFLSVVVGAILAFLWFNIPPSKFYMGETGILGLTTTLTVVAFLTKAVIVLPIIALPLVLASGSAIIQIISKRYFGRKVFLAAPLHHHFEAKGWPQSQVTMRLWVLSTVFAIIGMVIAIIGK